MNTLLLEHFDQLISTPYDVEQLDRLILFFALQGKLLPQNSSDEPASALFDRIQKANPDNKNIKPISDDEQPYELPSGWMWTTLPAIGEVNPRNNGIDDSTEASFIPMTNIPEEYAGELVLDIRLWGEIRKGYTHLQENDVAVAKITLCFENGKAVVMRGLHNGIGVGTTELYVFRGDPNFILPDYVLIFFKNFKFRQDGKRKMTGSAGQQRVPKEHVTLTPFPLPPFAEQQRIVARVEELFAQTRRLAEQLLHSRTELDRLNKSALAHLLASETPEEFNERWCFIADHFDLLTSVPEHIAPLRQSILELAVRGKLTRREPGDQPAKELLKRIKAGKNGKEKSLPTISESEKPFELPEGWEWAKLDEILLGIEAGKSFLAEGRPAQSHEFGVIKVSAVTWGEFDPNENKALLPGTAFRNEYLVQANDLLITRANTAELVGAVVLVDKDYPNLLLSDKTLRLNCVSEILKPFLVLALRAPWVRAGFADQAIGTSSSMRNISQDKIRAALIAILLLAEQERIVKRVEQLLGWCDALEAQLQSAEEERGRLVESVLATIGGQYGE